MVRTLLNNPALAIAVVTVLLFTVARIPTEIFYATFGVRPEDVGLDSVQVLLQGSAVVLSMCILGSVFYGLVIMALMIPYARFMNRALGNQSKASARRAARAALRLSPILIPVFSFVFSATILIIVAIEGAAEVKSGLELDGRFLPWKAEAVEVSWNEPAHPIGLPGCDSLFYLGEGDGRVALYDAKSEKTYRINSGDIELKFPKNCE